MSKDDTGEHHGPDPGDPAPAEVIARLYDEHAPRVAALPRASHRSANRRRSGGRDVPVVTTEILIDPADGTYLGERQFNAANGSVFLFSAMR
jgi:hypothetical protein